jgi:hypothetical protein
MASNKTKRINVKHDYIRDLADARTITVVSHGTVDMMACGETKALPEPKHKMIFRR